MYPHALFLGLDLYSIFIMVGILAAMMMIRILSDHKGLKAKLQNFVLLNTVIAVIGGYAMAVVTQALYNIALVGKFELTNSTGSTFYGGLVGGVVLFVVVYFTLGNMMFPDKYHVKNFRTVSDIAACCITIGHCFGRLGCLMAGCCHGARTDAWYGVRMEHLGYKVVPVQLFEAWFLFLLTMVLAWLFIKKKIRFQMPIYLLSYGVWRFFIEYLRGDERGQTIVSFLSPSQLTSIGLLLAGILLLVLEIRADRKRGSDPGDETDETENEEEAEESDDEIETEGDGEVVTESAEEASHDDEP